MPDAPDSDYDPSSATIPLSGPRPTLSGSNVDLPLPEELAKLLPAGAYEISGFLGAGGMGAVYKGMQIRLKRPVAIKIMRRDMGKDHDFEARFEREAQAMAKLNHPNIISVIDFGEAGPDYLFIVMELVDGTDLMDVIRSKQMTQEMALTLLPQICDALQFAHDHSIVHRDIKPSNIMLTRDGRVKMADFGLAKHFDHADTGFRTQTGTGMGTPDYAAPEQFDPTTPVDHRADIYALGVMIYQMITGALPRGVWRPPSQRAQVSTQWDAVVSRAMQNDPAERYQKASEVKTELSSIPLAGSKTDTPVRLSTTSGAAAKNQEADKSVCAPIKSRAPLFIGLVSGVVVIAVGAFFALRDTSPRSGGLKPPSPAATSTPGTSSSSAPINLLALVDVKRDAVKGQWELKPEGLLVRSGKPQLLSLHHTPPEEYDFEIEFTLSSGKEVDQVLPLSGGPIVWRMGFGDTTAPTHFFGFGPFFNRQNLNGTKRTEGVSQQPRFKLNQRYHSLVQVRKNSLRALLDGVEVAQWSGDLTRFTGEPNIMLPDPTQLGLESYESDIVFHKVELRPVAASGTKPDASSSPNLPVSKSSDPKFPPVQWVKLFTKPEDLPADLRKPDSGVTWEDGWIKGTLNGVVLRLPSNLSSNYAVRVRTKSATDQPFVGEGIAVRKQEQPGLGNTNSYQCKLGTGNKFMIQKKEDGQYQTLHNGSMSDVPSEAPEYAVEVGVVGKRLVSRWNSNFATILMEDQYLTGKASVSLRPPVRDIEVINLDGLPEAEALRLLGVDEQGKDVRGKSAASPAAAPAQNASGEVWEDLIKAGGWDAPWKIENGILTRPLKTKVERKWTSTPVKDGALRITRRWDAAWYDLHMMMRLRGPRLVNLQFTEPKDNKIAVLLTVERTTGKSSVTGMTKKSYQRGDIITIELRAVGENLTVSIDGETVATARDEAPIAGSYAIVSDYSDAPAIHRVEFLNLDGKTTGASATASSSALPVSKSSSPTIPLEPGAIRLWDAPEKLTSTPKGISWKDDALHIHSSVMAVRLDNKPLTHRDSIVRFSLRMNRDAQWANVIVRDAGTPAAPRQYKLSINPPTGVIKFLVADGGTERVLLSTPLPRPYAPEEWLRVELRSVGGDFTVSLDGQPLETVHDATLPNRGLAHFGATANAYFRDIVYVPLDQPAAVSSSPNLPVSKSSAATATKDAPFTNTLGMKFVPVPITGGPTDKQRVLFSVWETRVQDYEAYAKETKREWPKPDFQQGPTHPAVNVTWDEAVAFCAWLTERERKAGKITPNEAYRLPSDHEWSCAAGLGGREDASKTPTDKDAVIADLFLWGSTWPPPAQAGNYWSEELTSPPTPIKMPSDVREPLVGRRDSFAATAPVGSFPATPSGLHDLGGNVLEWCADWMDAAKALRVLRGGSWASPSREHLLVSNRSRGIQNVRTTDLGFRCVLAPAP